jgi:hypothetical protein
MRGKISIRSVAALAPEADREVTLRDAALAGFAVRARPGGAKAAAKVAPTVADLAQRFLAEHAEVKRKASTAREYRRLLDHVMLPGARQEAGGGSLDLFELLQRAEVGRVRPTWIDLRPCGPGNLADINIAVRIHR